jgi:hypothetical protein
LIRLAHCRYALCHSSMPAPIVCDDEVVRSTLEPDVCWPTNATIGSLPKARW